MTRWNVTTAASVSLVAAAIAGAPTAEAQSLSSNIVFSFLNERPNGEVVTGHVVNQGAFAEVPANGTATITSVFGYVYTTLSTAHYDVRVTKKIPDSTQYCDFHATATYEGSGRWTCAIQRQSSSAGATCSGRVYDGWRSTSPCGYDVDVK